MHTSLRSRYCPLPGSRRRSRVWVAGQSRKSTPWYGIGLNASKGLNRRCRVLQDPPSRVPRPPKSNGNTTGHGLMRAHSRLCFGSVSPLAPDRPSEPQRVGLELPRFGGQVRACMTQLRQAWAISYLRGDA
jgi:hypothetical protein